MCLCGVCACVCGVCVPPTAHFYLHLWHRFGDTRSITTATVVGALDLSPGPVGEGGRSPPSSGRVRTWNPKTGVRTLSCLRTTNSGGHTPRNNVVGAVYLCRLKQGRPSLPPRLPYTTNSHISRPTLNSSWKPKLFDSVQVTRSVGDPTTQDPWFVTGSTKSLSLSDSP